MRVIYIDILVFLNFYVTYFLVIGLCCFLHRKISVSRRIVSSLTGAFSSLTILLPPMPIMANLAIKLVLSFLITFASIGFGNIKTFLKNTFVFFIINCVYAGIMLALWLFAAPMGMVYNNGVSYFNIPLGAVILFTSAAYLILKIIRHTLDSKAELDKKYTVIITTSKGSVFLKAVPDSGNKLTDFISGLPVIFCDIKKCGSICPNEMEKLIKNENYDSSLIKGIRIIPCSTVSGSAVAYCFKPDEIIIDDGESKKSVNALIGFTKSGLKSNECDAIFNPHLF